jgi:hypothetical protein
MPLFSRSNSVVRRIGLSEYTVTALLKSSRGVIKQMLLHPTQYNSIDGIIKALMKNYVFI